MTASLPTPLGPLITIISGLGEGQIESELKVVRREDSSARSNSGFEALSMEGIGEDFWALAIFPTEAKSDLLGGFATRGMKICGLGRKTKGME